MQHPQLDYRFSLANERTYLAWIRTSLALIIGGVAAAKALTFHDGWSRWVISAPPILGGLVLAAQAGPRFRRYETAMILSHRLPVGRLFKLTAFFLPTYALTAFITLLLDR